jgi:hypothetical protein
MQSLTEQCTQLTARGGSSQNAVIEQCFQCNQSGIISRVQRSRHGARARCIACTTHNQTREVGRRSSQQPQARGRSRQPRGITRQPQDLDELPLGISVDLILVVDDESLYFHLDEVHQFFHPDYGRSVRSKSRTTERRDLLLM